MVMQEQRRKSEKSSKRKRKREMQAEGIKHATHTRAWKNKLQRKGTQKRERKAGT